MAAKGTEAKSAISEKILNIFPNAFEYGKELRIPYEENGEEVQIKVTLTCAKVNVSNPNLETSETSGDSEKDNAVSPSVSQRDLSEPSVEEKETLEELISKLHLY